MCVSGTSNAEKSESKLEVRARNGRSGPDRFAQGGDGPIELARRTVGRPGDDERIRQRIRTLCLSECSVSLVESPLPDQHSCVGQLVLCTA